LLETQYHEGHRANFASADLTGRDFSGLDLRGIKMDRAVLGGADFCGANLRGANLIGAIAQQARFGRADLSRARLSGANLVSASFVNARPARAEMEFCFDGKRILRGTYLRLAKLDSVDLSGANLDGADGMTQAQLDVAHCNTGTNSSRP